MKNNKFCNTPPLIENSDAIHDPLQKSNIFNNCFASKSTVPNRDEPAPFLERDEDISTISSLNTSPFQVARIIRNLKKSHISHCGILWYPTKYVIRNKMKSGKRCDLAIACQLFLALIPF